MRTLRIATRRSPLALWQAEFVVEALKQAHPDLDCELLPMRTQGDKLVDAPLAKVGGKGLFVKELELAMLDGRADIAVHSMKDVPVELPAGLVISTVLERGDPCDALVSNRYDSLDALPGGARIGSSSLRRQCQLMVLRPDLDIQNVRGSVQTRLTRLDNGDFDALILAASGLQRLQLAGRISQRFEPEQMLPAIGQGTLGIETREDDAELRALLAALDHDDSATRLRAERAFNEKLGGGCQVPFAGYAEIDDDGLWMRGLIASGDGTVVLRAQAKGPVQMAAELGVSVAEQLLRAGAGEIIDAAYADV
ncbi:MAG: hydroxymethylbilane synthase [Gammaproteobacteria bacterium]|nr:hydroxymethylbilane synthase [Gammaproteobacteria bacterium]